MNLELLRRNPAKPPRLGLTTDGHRWTKMPIGIGLRKIGGRTGTNAEDRLNGEHGNDVSSGRVVFGVVQPPRFRKGDRAGQHRQECRCHVAQTFLSVQTTLSFAVRKAARRAAPFPLSGINADGIDHR